MKLLDQGTCAFRDQYNQYMDDTHLGWPTDVPVLVPESNIDVNRKKRFRLNPVKTKWLWILGSLGLGDFPSLVIDKRTLPHSRMIHNLGGQFGHTAPALRTGGSCS